MIPGARVRARSSRHRCPPPGTVRTCACGSIEARIEALTGGTSGSESPVITRVSVRTRHSQGRLDPDRGGPALVEVAPPVRRVRGPDAGLLLQEVLVRGLLTADVLRRRRLEQGAVVVAVGGVDREQRPGTAGHSAPPAAGRGQHEPVHPGARQAGHLLGDQAAEGEAEHGERGDAQSVEHLHGQPGVPLDRQRLERSGRAAAARGVHRDRRHPGKVAQQRLPELERCPHAVEQQQRQAAIVAVLDADADPMAAHPQHPVLASDSHWPALLRVLADSKRSIRRGAPGCLPKTSSRRDLALARIHRACLMAVAWVDTQMPSYLGR